METVTGNYLKKDFEKSVTKCEPVFFDEKENGMENFFNKEEYKSNNKTFICEFCKNIHDGTYGSGRFCSIGCSKSRKESKSWNEAMKSKEPYKKSNDFSTLPLFSEQIDFNTAARNM